MTRPIRSLVAIALFVLAATTARASSLQLLAPASGATLRGGSFAELRWSAAELPRGAEEWEAFLSLDGGKYYAFRITPHLDLELHRFTFIVPNVDTHDARILIRAGNEVEETLFEARGTFSIKRDSKAGQQLFPRLAQPNHGEAAREGDPAVISWIDGTRDGSDVVQYAATSTPRHSLLRHQTVPEDEPPLLTPVAHSIALPIVAIARVVSDDTNSHNAGPLARSVDLLLVCRRRNV